MCSGIIEASGLKNIANMVFSEDKGKLLVNDETPYGTQSCTLSPSGYINEAVREGGVTTLVSAPSSQATANHKEYSVYKRRWYILLVFVLLNTVQCIIWNTWGPLADSMKAAFYWDDSTIALQTNWGPISYVVAIVPGVWLMDVKGMRVACVVAGLLTAIGGALRCITLQVPTFTWLVHAGQIVAGVAGPVFYAGSPVLSACWFPVHQRTTATSLATMGSALGMALSFILGPALVQDARYTNDSDNYTTPSVAASGEDTNASLANADDIKHDVMRLMYIECGAAVAVFILVLAYFPHKPPKPPSLSAAQPRMEFLPGLVSLIKNKRFWLLSLTFSITIGVYDGWCTILDVIVSPIGVSQEQAGWMGFIGILASGVAGTLVSLGADMFSRRMRLFLVAMFSVAVLAFLIFALIVAGIIPFHIAALYVTVLVGSICVPATAPLFFELVCEASYPVAEGITNGFLTWLSSLFTMVYLIILLFPQLGVAWVNWVMVSCVVVSLPAIYFYREKYTRLDTDTAAGASLTHPQS